MRKEPLLPLGTRRKILKELGRQIKAMNKAHGVEEPMVVYNQWLEDNTKRKPFIVCAANRYKDVVLLGPRHYNAPMRAMVMLLGLNTLHRYALGDEEQGFIDQWGAFYTREQAREVVIGTGQCKEEELDHMRELFSEDLY